MAGSRTLKLSILADVDDLKKKLGTAENEVEGFGGKLEKFGKVAGAAFLAAGAAATAYAGKLAVEGVKAAIADEAAQLRLSSAIQNVTNATNDQIAAIEDQISKTSLATGVADDKLRPALQKLVVSTGSLEKSQSLLNLALDISAATGKDLDTVSSALSKAYDGNTGALSKLNVGLGTAEIKSLGLEGATDKLQKLFGGAAKTQAETLEGKIARLGVAFDETKEAVGARLLPIVTNFLDYVVNTLIPKFLEVKDKALKPVTDAIENNKDAFETLYNFIRKFVVPILVDGLGDALGFIGKVAGGILTVIATVVNGIKGAVTIAIDAINTIIKAYNAIPILPNIPTIPVPTGGGTSAAPKTPSTPTVPKPTLPVVPAPSSGGGGGGGGGSTAPVGGGGLQLLSVPSGKAIPSNFDVGAVRMGEAKGDVIINVNSASIIDREGFARAVVEALNESADRGTGGGGGLRIDQQAL